MSLFKLLFLPMKMMMWPMTAPCHMMKRLFKMAFHIVAVTLLVAQLMVMLLWLPCSSCSPLCGL